MISAPRIFLDGGGDGRQAVDRAFATAARTAGVGRVLYLPYAMAPLRRPGCRVWFEAAYRAVFTEIVMPEDPSQAVLGEWEFGAVYLGGGDTGRLLDTLRATGLDGLIARHVSRGGLLCGGSAGAIVCGATISTAPPEEHSARSNEGLNLLGGAGVLAHYQDSAGARAGALGLAAELRATALWALPENSGIRLDASGVPRALGERACLRFTAGGQVSRIPPDAE
ncbi:Type 1 glutamine amidotransferase-like domain-containing protein [Streptomyces pinistramenti]|uniref:Type 1 glutamine amidotransferase-like domain-containing protein n=1 Tax=Streptomyces pinistramenti TaxID=2884812 RepID=UPI001D094237|nr:Type 1 glutamine amidotransferase-like domain-containing protein [Streptomyces pinistramenti]MCB5907508.1 Type 1 glutamine amidotransferase-like domain-containing protein [Streptomyces pinistramenti]